MSSDSVEEADEAIQTGWKCCVDSCKRHSVKEQEAWKRFKKLLEKTDDDGDGSIALSEFIKNYGGNPDVAKDLFSQLDTNKSGTLTKADLGGFVRKLQETEQCHRKIKAVKTEFKDLQDIFWRTRRMLRLRSMRGSNSNHFPCRFI